ncbi:MAG: BMP family ABC transporter substrate-binding protein [Lachnospiraceae bacterium]|nr:BMP family ABC transporter substrate-binding protein [Lachnospiraceae bacterium]
MLNRYHLKRLLCTAALSMTLSGLAGCGGVDIGFITDMGTVQDGAFNQGSYEGVERYTQSHDKKCKLYEPESASTSEYTKKINEAVRDGADIIICPGELFEEAIYNAQKKHPRTKFILIDGEPHDPEGRDFELKDNTMAVQFSEEQAGFLAGYSAVRDGNTELGFVGGASNTPIIKFGYGFVQGADYAAIETGKQIKIRYCYANTFIESEDVGNMVSAWYKGGTQVIFACGGAMGRSVFAAAEANGGKVIGVDIDQSAVSETVITSAKKQLGNAVYEGLNDYYNNAFKGGSVYMMDASNNGIALEMENSRFENFTQEQYDAIYEQLRSGRIVPYSATDYGNTSDLELVNTEVFYLELNQ